MTAWPKIVDHECGLDHDGTYWQTAQVTYATFCHQCSKQPFAFLQHVKVIQDSARLAFTDPIYAISLAVCPWLPKARASKHSHKMRDRVSFSCPLTFFLSPACLPVESLPLEGSCVEIWVCWILGINDMYARGDFAPCIAAALHLPVK